MRIRVLTVLMGLFCSSSFSQSISASEATNFIGKQKTVCAYVASAKFAVKSRGQPTFLDMDNKYPDQLLTIVIWGSDRSKFDGAPEATYLHKTICITGKIELYKGTPEIIVRSPAQIVEKK